MKHIAHEQLLSPGEDAILVEWTHDLGNRDGVRLSPPYFQNMHLTLLDGLCFRE